jgi:general secretion pathway protein A
MPGMDVDPFSTSPDPRFLFLTEALREAAAKVRYVIERRQGLTVLYGPVGMGKSSLTRMLYGEYAARPDVRAVYVPNPHYDTGLALLKAVGDEFGVPRRRARIDQQTAFQAYLVEQYAAERNVVVFLDEAQRFTGPVLETIRTMLNFETDEAKLVQIVLTGQMELRDRLRDPTKKALRSRIFTSSTLSALSRAGTVDMIRYRLEQAAAPDLFEPDALEAIYHWTKGVPRDVMKLCSAAYEYARATAGRVTAGEIDRAAPDAELDGDVG